jgi:cytidylate kinase
MVIIAVDGPVGAGKSTAARLLAKRMGYAYLDTGATYRAIGWKAHAEGTGLNELNEESLARLCAHTRIEIELTHDRQRIVVDGKDVTAEIRTPAMSRMASAVAGFAPVRSHLVRMQRQTGLNLEGRYGGVVVEGRDIGTVVFPDASVKFYMDADIAERGRRRWEELKGKGLEVDLPEIIKGIMKRDEYDKGRSVDPLRKAPDAIVIDTTCLALEEVVERMLKKIPQDIR